MTDERDAGLEFGDLQDDLESESYPLTTEDILEKYGDREVGTESGSETVTEILGPSGEETFEDADEVHQAILSMVDDSAVGRIEYTDRGSNPSEEDSDSF